MNRFAMFALSMLLAFTGVAAVQGTASAGTGLYYTVVDADNDPYSGLYLRDGTSMGNVRQIYQRYMLYGARVELNCGTWGESVGPRANRRWHHVRVASGHNVGEQGWVADRYLNTPNIANQPTPGEPECGSAPPPPPPAPRDGGSVYYSPESPNLASGANIHKDYNTWIQPGVACGTANAGSFPSFLTPSNQYVTTMAGWSLGRVGPIYFLAANRHRWNEIDYIILFDPGNYDDIVRNDCDMRHNPGYLYHEWLRTNPNAKLVVMSGSRTAQGGHSGIQKAYFEYMKTHGGARDRVVVCNFTTGHNETFERYRSWINKPPINKGACPDGVWSWNP